METSSSRSRVAVSGEAAGGLKRVERSAFGVWHLMLDSKSTSLLVREPFAQYLSFYNYYIAKHQNEKPVFGKQWPDVEGPQAWGSDAGEWALGAPDMQVRELLGNKCTTTMRQPGFDVLWDGNDAAPRRTGRHVLPEACTVSADDFAAFEDVIREGGIDVVGVTEKFDSFLLLVARAAGVMHPQYAVSNSGGHEKRRDKVATDVIDAVEASTFWDRRAHVAVAERHEALVRKAGGVLFEAEVAAFQAATVRIGSRDFIGGAPPLAPYAWLDAAHAASAGLTRVVPQAFTEDTGGGQAVAYIYFKPVVLVRKTEAEAQMSASSGGDEGLRCIKGCTFDA